MDWVSFFGWFTPYVLAPAVSALLGWGAVAAASRSRQTARHDLDEARRDAPLDHLGATIGFKGQEWMANAGPVQVETTLDEATIFSYQGKVTLEEVKENHDSLKRLAEGLKEKGLTDQSFSQMMTSEAEIRIGVQRGTWRRLQRAVTRSATENDLRETVRDFRDHREGLEILGRLVKHVDDQLVKFNGADSSFPDKSSAEIGKSVVENGFPQNFQKVVSELYADYPRTPEDIVERVGTKEESIVARVLSETPSRLSRPGLRARRRERKALEAARKTDSETRKQKNLPAKESKHKHL